MMKDKARSLYPLEVVNFEDGWGPILILCNMDIYRAILQDNLMSACFEVHFSTSEQTRMIIVTVMTSEVPVLHSIHQVMNFHVGLWAWSHSGYTTSSRTAGRVARSLCSFLGRGAKHCRRPVRWGTSRRPFFPPFPAERYCFDWWTQQNQRCWWWLNLQ